MSNEQPLQFTVPEVIVRSSIQVFVGDKDNPKPQGFGSGCILFHRGRYFLISVRHVTDFNLTTFMETGIPAEQNGQPGNLLQPIGGLCYFDLFKVTNIAQVKEVEDLFRDGKKLDITFAEIKHNIELRQQELDFKAFKIPAGHKIILDSRDTALPSKDKNYAFFGRVRHSYEGYNLKMENAFRHNLVFHRTDKYFHIFKNPDIIRNEEDFQGCSGAPIIDSDGKLVGLACIVVTGSLLIFGFSIQECIKLLDIAIDTGMLIEDVSKEQSLDGASLTDTTR